MVPRCCSGPPSLPPSSIPSPTTSFHPFLPYPSISPSPSPPSSLPPSHPSPFTSPSLLPSPPSFLSCLCVLVCMCRREGVCERVQACVCMCVCEGAESDSVFWCVQGCSQPDRLCAGARAVVKRRLRKIYCRWPRSAMFQDHAMFSSTCLLKHFNSLSLSFSLSLSQLGRASCRERV